MKPVPKLERILLGVYLIALIGLLILPISVPGRLGSIGGDKLVHVGLFGGLSILLRWNLAARRNALVNAVVAAIAMVIATEFAQHVVAHRSAEMWDVAAGFVGAVMGAVGMNRLMLSSAFETHIGLLVALLGLVVAVLFFFADIIGVSKNNEFGPFQTAGMALGAMIFAGGAGICIRSLRNQSRSA